VGAAAQDDFSVLGDLKAFGSYSRCMHLRNMMAKSAALGQGVLAKK
jgi:hypothetical protein